MKIAKFKVLVFILLVVTIAENDFAQNRKIDSLKLLLATANEDTNKVNILYHLGEEYWNINDAGNTLENTNASLILAQKLNFESKEIDAHMCLANVNASQRNIAESRYHFSLAVELLKKEGNKEKIADAYFEIASNQNSYGNFQDLLENSIISLKLYEESGRKYKIGKTYLLIANIYKMQDALKYNAEVEGYYLKALKLFGESSEKTQYDIGYCYHFLGRVYLLKKDYSKALQFFEAASNIWREIDDKSWLKGSTFHIGLVYKGRGDSALLTGNKQYAASMFRKYILYLKKALEISNALTDYGGIASAYQELGDIYIYFGQYYLSKNYLDKALLIAKKGNDQYLYKITYYSISRLDSAEGNFKLAYLDYKLFQNYKDTIEANSNSKKIDNYKILSAFNKKEDSLQQKQILTETNLTSQKKQLHFYWIGLTLFAMLFFFVFRNFQNQRKLNKLAAETFTKEKTNLELQSLKAQLNPHFIFNCINSIDSFIQTSDKYNATLYLNKFAKLIRNVLDSSKENVVTFSKDIDALRLYIELEELRSENKFSTQLNIDEELMNSDCKVPPLIIQPFVENAIIHGLRNREGNEGLLKIAVSKTNDYIVYTITDNGIGRMAAKNISSAKEKSYGIQMGYDRVKLFNKEDTASVIVTDLYNDEVAGGTEVTIHLKLI